ncbi:MAG: SAM-dependent methyltransferase [Chloroflexi bacterium]|nr:SAM-dependent methyltransferase [Chloroflexota bacterium]
MPPTPRNWLEWHHPYDDPTSSLSRRLRTVQGFLRDAIDAHPCPIRLISMCAGQGRDVIPVLAEHPRRDDVTALLVELDPRNADAARAAARLAGLGRVNVLADDAALTGNYAAAAPADIVLACGIFGNITDADIKNTVQHLPQLCAEGATVLWTRGRRPDNDITPQIRRWFAESGFEEVAFEALPDTHHSVGAHRLIIPPPPLEPGLKLFQFVR